MQGYRKVVAIGSSVALGVAGAVAGVGVTAASSAETNARPVSVVASDLGLPFGLKKARHHRGLLVAEGAGNVTRVFLNGRTRVILDGVPGVAGVAGSSRRVFAVIGGEPGSGGEYGPSRLLRMNYRGGNVRVIANLLRYELNNNPDGQLQFNDEGDPVDALSNPFALEWSKYGLFVADGGANDVLKVNPRTGRISTFFVPRTFRDTPECENAPNNDETTIGCDPVPTGVDVVGRSLYVSFLGAHQPGAGRVYKLNARTGKVQRIWRGLTAPTGVVALKSGAKYVTHVEQGAPTEQPPPPATEFNYRAVGEITRIKGGERTHAQVTMPTGITFAHGRLYSTAWSIAPFFGLEQPGRVVRVKFRAFR